MGTPAALVLRRSNRTICRTALSKGFRAAPKIGIRLMFLSNRGLEPHWLLGCWGNKHQRIKIATKSYAYLSYWRLATGLARRAIPEPSIWPAAALPKRAFNRAAPRGVARSASRCQQLWCGDFDVAHVLFVAVRRPHTEREGFRHARNVAA